MRIASQPDGQSVLFAFALAAASVVIFGGSASAAEGQKDVATTPILTTESAELKWAPIDALPKGAEFAVLASAGDWSVVRVKFPPHYVVPPHSHPNAEAVTLVSGDVGFGFAETADTSGPFLQPGAFFALKAGGIHYVWTGDAGGVIDVQVSDPGGISYVHPADDPRMKM